MAYVVSNSSQHSELRQPLLEEKEIKYSYALFTDI